MKKIASLPRFWENISFYNNNTIEPEAIISVSRAHYISAIKKLDLSLTKINKTALGEITSKCVNLKELILESCIDLTGGLSIQVLTETIFELRDPNLELF